MECTNPLLARCFTKYDQRNRNILVRSGLTALQNIRWKKTGSIDISNMKILFDGYNEREQLGANFAVYKSIVLTIKDLK